ncbi:DMT family transporter [Streptomyces rubradiris]|uniref:Membrane protein n=1 Tax=Streptomyces rubradiris TaxID=285531 RepID=A0ABQ3R828_STRRR|nr:DMT family transporter [Streptomyces rubradiris]GHH24487.1 membrane protein [Streptomyces rubradiris]GHI52005.1 membrane protein [Streptomyces rubradiris]GHI58333.1 membrane protein [Streptomyces rubradiris]
MATPKAHSGTPPRPVRAPGGHGNGGVLAGIALAVAAAAAMGGAAPALKAMGTAGLSAVDIIQARAVVGAVLLMLIAAVVHRGRLRVRVRDWWLVLVYGTVSLAVNQVAFTMALTRLPVGVALLVEYLSPVLVALWVRLVQGKQLSGLVWLGIALALGGLALTGRVWSSGGDLDRAGLALALLAALTMASRFLLAERGLRAYEPLVMSAWGTTVDAAVLTLVGVIDPFPFSALWRDAALNDHSLPVWGLVVWVGVIGMAGGLALGVAAQRRLPPTSASLMLTLEVVAGAVAAYLVLGEVLTPPQLAGSVLMLLGIVLSQSAALRRRPPAEAAVTDPAPGGDRGSGRHRSA